MKLQGKVAVITGGTSGIGEATAYAFSKEGAKLVIAGRRDNEGNRVVEAIQKSGGDAIFVKTDVTDEEQVKALIANAVSQYGKLDIAFNNAGVEQTGPISEFTVDAYEHVFNINVRGVFLSLKHEIEVMKEKGGSIINTSSIVGHVAMPGASIYIASKHAVEGITKTAALELVEHNIRVNAIAPAAIETEMIDRFAGPKGSESRDFLTSLHPMGRFGKPDEIAQAAVFLASDDSSYVNGNSLPVDGGYLAR